MADDPIAAVGPAILEALRKGHKIEAIKLLRQASGLGLAEAKYMVERYEKGGMVSSGKEGGPAVGAKQPVISATAYRGRPGLSPGQVAPSEGGPIAFVVIALIAAAVAAFVLLH